MGQPAYALELSLWNAGQTARAVDSLAAVERIAATTKDPLELGVARFARAVVFLVTDLAGAGTFADDAIHDAEITGNPHQLAWAYAGALVLAAGRRDSGQAQSAFLEVRRWAELAHNRAVLTIAPSFLAMATPEDEPLETLSLVRDVLVMSVDTGLWAHLDFTLRRVILSLIRLDHARSAALLLGGMTSLTSATPDTQHVVPMAPASPEPNSSSSRSTPSRPVSQQPHRRSTSQPVPCSRVHARAATVTVVATPSSAGSVAARPATRRVDA